MLRAKGVNPCDVWGIFTRATVFPSYLVAGGSEDYERRLLSSCLPSTLLVIENVTVN